MYFIEDVIKYNYVDEIKFMINHYNCIREKYPEFRCLWEKGLNECQYLLTIIQNCMFTHNDMIDVKKYATIARELRLGQMNKQFLTPISEKEMYYEE